MPIRIEAVYDEASSVLGYDVAALCFDGPAERLNLTEYTQPALLVSSVAALKLFEPSGITPIAVAGHSLGEYSALVAAGGITFRDAVAIVQKRGRYMAEAVAAGNRTGRRLAGSHGRCGERCLPGASSVGSGRRRQTSIRLARSSLPVKKRPWNGPLNWPRAKGVRRPFLFR